MELSGVESLKCPDYLSGGKAIRTSSPGLVFPGREGIFCGFQCEAGYAFCAGLAYIMLCKLSCVGSSYEPCIV